MGEHAQNVLTIVAGGLAVLVLVALIKRQSTAAMPGLPKPAGVDANALAKFLATEGGTVSPAPGGVDAGSLAAFLAQEGGSMADQIPPLPF
jgi:hypothetical protein